MNNNEVKQKNIEKIKFKKYVSYSKRVRNRIKYIILSLIACIIFLLLSVKINVDKNLTYYQKSNINYKVNLKNNKYYTNRTLNQDMLYIASLLSSIDITFDYKFNTSEKLDYKYSYSVDTDIQVYDENSNSSIYSKKESLISEKVTEMKNSDSFDLEKKININYDRYNNIAKKFKSDYSISSKSRLVITLNIKVMDKNNNKFKKLDANNQMKIIIPLTEQMVNINLDYKEINNKDTIVKHTNIMVANKPLFIIAILFGVVSVVLIISLVLFIYKVVHKNKTNYDKELSRILREYDRVIVEIKQPYIIGNQEIIDVKSFNELLDARDNIEKPILFKEIHKGAKSEFIVKGEDEIYRYYLKAVDLEDNKKTFM